MEHHTYAKCDTKTWTIEQKRSLVTKCISEDYLFKKPSLRSDRAWKTFKETAQIGDFNENELRQQWQALVHEYRMVKKGISTPINNQIIASLNKKWEFFGEMHKFMIKKNDHHSYAQNAENDHNAPSNVTNTRAAKVLAEAQSTAVEINAENLSVDVGVEVGSFVPSAKTPKIVAPNPKTQKKVMEVNPFLPPTKLKRKEDNSKDDDREVNQDDIPTPPEILPSLPPTLSENNQNNKNSAQPKPRESRKRPAGKELSKRDKYYRRRRRYCQRMEKRFKLLGQATGVILIHMASRLGAQAEMPDLSELFAADSSTDSDSSADEDSDQD